MFFFTVNKRMGQYCLMLGLLWGRGLVAADPPPGSPLPQVTVEISGLSSELEQNVRLQLSLPGLKPTDQTTETKIRRLHQRAESEIQQALKPFGHYAPVIQTDLKQQDHHWIARYTIAAGPVVKIRACELALTGPGAQDPLLTPLVAKFPLKAGDELRHSGYEAAKKDWLSTMRNLGYLEAHFTTHRLRVDVAAQQADIILQADTGPRYLIKSIRFEQDFLDDGLLQRYLPQQPPFPYSTQALLAIHSALSNSHYFDWVDIQAEPATADADHGIPAVVKLRANAAHYFAAGVGYGTDTGARLSSEWQWRHLNRQGHELATTLNISQLRADMTAAYTIPRERPQQEKWRFSLALQEEYGTDIPSSALKLVANRINVFQWGASPRPWIQTLYTNYLWESFEIGGQTEESTFILIGGQYEARDANDALYPTRGWLLSFSLQGAAEALLSSTSLIQGKLTGKYIMPLGDNSRIKMRGDLGTTWVDDFARLPKSLRYFAGGDNSVRGYGYESLGPQNEQGQVIGGKHLMTGSLEYDYRFKPKWAAAVFYDMGMALNTTANWGDQLFSGVGTGIRWFSPVGPIRADIAFPLDESPDTWRLHVTIGADL